MKGRRIVAVAAVAVVLAGGCAALLDEDLPFAADDAGADAPVAVDAGPCTLLLDNTTVDLGEQPVGLTSTPARLSVTNDGGSAVTVTPETAPGSRFTMTIAGPIAAGSKADVLVTLTAPASPEVITEAAALSAPGCRFPITLRAKVTDAPLLLDTDLVTFGDVACRSGIPGVQVRFRASPRASGTWKASLDADAAAAFVLRGETSGPMPAGGMATVQVEPSTLGRLPGPRTGMLEIALTPDGGAAITRKVRLEETIVGPLVAVAPSITKVARGTNFDVTVRNGGNRPFDGLVAVNPIVASPAPSTLKLAVGEQKTVNFFAASTGADAGEMGFTARAGADPVCVRDGGTIQLQ